MDPGIRPQLWAKEEHHSQMFKREARVLESKASFGRGLIPKPQNHPIIAYENPLLGQAASLVGSRIEPPIR